MSNRAVAQHWPVMLLGIAVVAIFLAVLVTFEVNETEYADYHHFLSAAIKSVDKFAKVGAEGSEPGDLEKTLAEAIKARMFVEQLVAAKG